MSRSPILTRHSEGGAVPGPGEFHSSETPWHFGDPLGEQRTAATGVIIVDRSDRSVIEIPGDERLSWLHTISSQHIAKLPDRRSAENLSLDANGRVEEHFVLTDIDGVTWIDTEGARGEALITFLTKMVFWAKAEPATRTDMKVLTLVGPGAVTGPVAELLEIDADAEVYQAGSLPETHHEDEPLGFWRRMPPLGEHRDLPVVDLVVPEFVLLRWWDALTEAGARMAGSWAYDALRVAARRPRLGADTDERTIPHEVDWIGGPAEQGAVHLDKGCYRGQETVARVHNLGKSPRRLVLLHLDGSSDRRPTTGDPVTAGGRTVGRLGTVIDHYEWGPIALALVKRNVGADTELMIGAEEPVSARIDPDSIREDEHVQAGRAAVERLRSGATGPGPLRRVGTGTVLAVCAAGQDVVLDGIGPSAIDKRPLTGRAEVHELGLAADHQRNRKYHGGVDQAVYAYAERDARRWAGELGRDLAYGWFGENLRIDGIVTDAFVGERWQVGEDGLVLETTIPRVPCRTFAVWAGEPRWVKRFMEQADFGAYLRVLQPGTVAAGDSVTVIHRPDHGVRVRHLLADGDPEAIRGLLEHDDLPAKVRREALRVVTRTDTRRGVARQGEAHKS